MVPCQNAKSVETMLEELSPVRTDFMFEPDGASMTAHGLVSPEPLMTNQSRIFVLVENYDGMDARLESDTALGLVVRQEADLYYYFKTCCSCKVERPETASRTLRVQANRNNSVKDAPGRCQKSMEVLGRDSTCIDGDLTVEELRQLKKLVKANHVFALDDNELQWRIQDFLRGGSYNACQARRNFSLTTPTFGLAMPIISGNYCF